MATNCLTSLTTNLRQRQMAILNLTFDRKFACKIRTLINVDLDNQPPLLTKWADEIQKQDKAIESLRGTKTVSSYIEDHRTHLFSENSPTLKHVYKDPLQLVRYYHWLGTLNAKERLRRELVPAEENPVVKNLRKRKRGTTKQKGIPIITTEVKQNKKRAKLRSFTLVPCHGYKRLSLDIQTATFLKILTKIHFVTNAQARKLNGTGKRQLWESWIDTGCIRSPAQGFDFAYFIHTNGVQVSIMFDKIGKTNAEVRSARAVERAAKRKRKRDCDDKKLQRRTLSLPQRGRFTDKEVCLSETEAETVHWISVDPGTRDLVTIQDGTEIRKFSAKEWRHWRRTGVFQKRSLYHQKQFRLETKEHEIAFREMAKQTFTTFSSVLFMQEWESADF